MESEIEYSIETNKTVFLMSNPHHSSIVQYHESDFEDNEFSDAITITTTNTNNHIPFCFSDHKGTDHEEMNDSDSELESDSKGTDHKESDSDNKESDSDSEPESFMESLTEPEQEMFHEECLRLFGEFFEDATNRAKMSSPIIEQTITSYIASAMYDTCELFFQDGKMPKEFRIQESDYEEIYEYVLTHIVEYAFQNEMGVKPRQRHQGCSSSSNPLYCAMIDRKLAFLNSCPNPPQRSQEWYDSRYDALTASNIWKALGSEAQRNSLIFEKCKPYDQFVAECSKHANLSTENAMHWGIKYEPVTVHIYEHKEQTRVSTSYGCIRHPDYPFLGASPDAIVVDPKSPKYGRMVEIKNIVNREITGVPLEHYWIQMQTQMEVCDLDLCDFVETQIREYGSSTEFYSNSSNRSHEYRGVVIRFTERLTVDEAIERRVNNTTNHPAFYDYLSVLEQNGQEQKQEQKQTHNHMSVLFQNGQDQDQLQTQIESWIRDRKLHYLENYVAYQISYWYLDKYSCVEVPRNVAWFDAVLPAITECWETIQREKQEGYDHRAPKSNANRKKNAGGNGPLIQINKLDMS